MTCILGLIFLITSMAGLGWLEFLNKGVIESFTSSLRNDTEDWNWMVFFAAVIAVLAGGGYFIDFIRKKREFKEKIDTNSKKAFIENQEDIEVLAWKLGTSYEDKVDEKMAELKIKR